MFSRMRVRALFGFVYGPELIAQLFSTPTKYILYIYVISASEGLFSIRSAIFPLQTTTPLGVIKRIHTYVKMCISYNFVSALRLVIERKCNNYFIHSFLFVKCKCVSWAEKQLFHIPSILIASKNIDIASVTANSHTGNIHLLILLNAYI